MNNQRKRIFGVIPLPLGLEPKMGDDLYRQGVAIAVVLFCITMIMYFLLLGIFIAHSLSYAEMSTELSIMLGIAFVSTIQTVLYYRYTNIRATAMVMMVFYYLMTVTVVFVTGGFDSPVITILLCTVAVSYRFGESGDGMMNSLLVFFAILIFMGLKSLEMPPLYVLDGLNKPTVFFLGWFSTIFTISACLMTYHYDRKD